MKFLLKTLGGELVIASLSFQQAKDLLRARSNMERCARMTKSNVTSLSLDMPMLTTAGDCRGIDIDDDDAWRLLLDDELKIVGGIKEIPGASCVIGTQDRGVSWMYRDGDSFDVTSYIPWKEVQEIINRCVTCLPEHVAKFTQWIDERGGVALWLNREIGSTGSPRSWCTPAIIDGQMAPPPNWRCGPATTKPTLIAKTTDDVLVVTEIVLRQFTVTPKTNGYLTKRDRESAERLMNEARNNHWDDNIWFEHEQHSCEVLIKSEGDTWTLTQWLREHP